MEHLKEQISQYYDGELPEGDRRAAEAHLSACPQCRAELAHFKELSSALKSLPQKPLPPGFHEHLARRLKSEPAPPAPGSRLLPPSLRLPAYALSGLITASFLYNQWRGPGPAQLPAAEPLARARGSALIEEPPRAAQASPAAAAPGPYTNEDLQRDLELQKKRMGIRAIAPPRDATVEALPVGLEEVQHRPAYIEGEVPSLLTPAQPSAPEPLRPPLGKVLGSEGERAEFWRLARLKATPPFVDYSQSLLAVLVGQDPRSRVEIAGVERAAEAVVIQYRQFRQLSKVPGGADLSVEWRVLPKSGLPVVFEEVR
ncbi:MAG: zf-HC2 domain-containing protein [Elusimicrobia bacterium]|nr:zf-HC2 domain-containing protein [Elusimicrobiota bacterium]